MYPMAATIISPAIRNLRLVRGRRRAVPQPAVRAEEARVLFLTVSSVSIDPLLILRGAFCCASRTLFAPRPVPGVSGSSQDYHLSAIHSQAAGEQVLPWPGRKELHRRGSVGREPPLQLEVGKEHPTGALVVLKSRELQPYGESLPNEHLSGFVAVEHQDLDLLDAVRTRLRPLGAAT